MPSPVHVTSVLAQKGYGRSMCIAGTEDRECSISWSDKKAGRRLGVGQRHNGKKGQSVRGGSKNRWSANAAAPPTAEPSLGRGGILC